MQQVDILQKIIEEGGSCCWSDPSICALCPLSKLKIKPNGNYLSCIESIGAENLTEEEADAKYKLAAESALLDLQMHSVLGG
jgi:hypothetical protein